MTYFSYGDYYFKGRWNSKNTDCIDSRKVFEAIVLKPEDVIRKVSFFYGSTNKMQSFTYLQYKDEWKHYDNHYHGRCFTMSPTPEQIRKGILYIELDIAVNSTIYIHTPGLLFHYPSKKITFFGEAYRQFRYVEVGKSFKWTLNYEFHELKGKSTSTYLRPILMYL